MFKTIKATTNIVRSIAYHANEARAYRKEQRVRRYKEEAYEQMIAESQTKIGPYKPATTSVRDWA